MKFLPPTDRTRAILCLVGTSILWSFGGLLIKLVSWNPFAIAGMRSAIAALILLLVIRRPRITWSLPQLGGAFSYAATVILFVTANKLTTAANAILLQYTAPIFVAILGALLLKERTRLADWITILIVLGGMFLFFLDDLSSEGFFGNILAIISGVSFAFLVVFMRMQKDSSPLESVFLGNIATVLVGFPFMLQSSPDASGWLGLVLLGVFQLGLSYILYSAAIKHVTALDGILVPILEPLLNPLWVFIFMGEAPGMWAFIGGFIVLISVTFRCLMGVRDTRSP